jgi:phosphoglycerol transferase MdoB-like AlkP superfamily enzyme
MKYIKEMFDFKNKYLKGLFTFFILLVSSFLIMTLTFIFASPVWNIDMPLFRSYFTSPLLILMNIIPIFLFMTTIYLISNRLWVGFLSSTLFVILAVVNKFKLTYRDDPFSFIDIKLIKESMEMTNRYEIRFTPNMIAMFIGLIIITVLLALIFNYKINSKKMRFSLLTIVIIGSIITFKGPYFNYELYNKIGDKELINIWSQTQQFQSKGFVYPFIYSITSAKDRVLEGYDEERAIQELNKYEYKDISADKKVNIISIMFEAYNDFSKFENVEFKIDPYVNFHEIQNESIHGHLVTNIFAGDTIQTERSFITGYNNHPQYFSKTNSFVWYLKDQGYRTEAMHPIYGWFYNRRNVNPDLGFDSFDYYENKYQAIREEFYEDFDFFDFIIEGFENSKSNNDPYFNFTVTYQNHGPYSDEKYSENQFLKKKETYDEKTYNIINNYLAGISKTDKAIKKLIDYFENEEEPTIIVFFGDHNPWLGKDATGYEMLGIDLDLGKEEGFKNYYETPYVIWGNDSAKEVLDNDLVGVGRDVSPNLLMAELFEVLSWKGNEYMQFLMDYKAHIDVNNKVYFKEDGKYTDALSPDNQERYDNFLNVEYYFSHNFKEKELD